MASLSVKPEELKSIGKTIRTDGENFSNLLREIKAHNSNLQASWKGEDADRYTQKIEEQAKVMDNLADAIDSVGLFLTQIAEAYEAAQQEAKDSLK